ncbi:hypothetical protein ACVWZK_002803 [Bradyrhizobium sp. GM0.4]
MAEAAMMASETLWQKIRDEAQRTAAADAIFGKALVGLILVHDDFTAALSDLIGRRLGDSEVERARFTTFSRDAFNGQPDLIEAAGRDLQAIVLGDPAISGVLAPLLHLKGYVALQAWRVSNWLWHHDHGDAALLFQNEASNVLQVSIHPAASLGSSVYLDHATGIVIGADVVIGDRGHHPSERQHRSWHGTAGALASHWSRRVHRLRRDNSRQRQNRRFCKDRRRHRRDERRAPGLHRNRQSGAADQLPRARFRGLTRRHVIRRRAPRSRGAAAALAAMTRADRLRTGLARRVQHRDVMPVDQLPALPAREKQNADHDQGQRHAPRLDCSFRALRVAEVEIDQGQHDGYEIADHVIPGVIEAADAGVAEEVGEAGHGRNERHHNTGADQPDRGSGPKAVTGADEGEIGDGRADQEGDGERDDHGVERMIADRGGRLGVDAHGKTSREVIFQTIFRTEAGSSDRDSGLRS